MSERAKSPPKSPTRRLSPSRERRHSRLECLYHRRGRHLASARVEYCRWERLLKLQIPLRPRSTAHQVRDRLVGQDETPEERMARVLQAEILGDEGPES